MNDVTSKLLPALALLWMVTGCEPQPTLAPSDQAGTAATATADNISAALTRSAPTIQALTLNPIVPPTIQSSTAQSSAASIATSTPVQQIASSVPPTTSTEPLPIPPSVTPCMFTWFTDKVVNNSCATEPAARLEAAYQTFEHGAMLWVKGTGFTILPFDTATGTQQGIVSFYPDEITIYRDTSADVTAPAGLLAPVSGFGYVWRGDSFEEPGHGLKDVLGWATASEVGYTATIQHGSQQMFYSGVVTVLLTYVTLPDGRILQLARIAQPNQMTSLSFIQP